MDLHRARQQGDDLLARSLPLPCGATLSNRIAKAAMTEGLADPALRATPRLETLYRRWGAGGAGLLITGNVQVDRRYLERPGNVVIDDTWPATTDAAARRALSDWARAGAVDGTSLWMQISHAGRQTPRYVCREPVAPSAVGLDLLGSYGRPRALEEAEILEIVRRFATAAAVARECGFGGVQVHAAHGYLLSSFLSQHTNRRTDDWGGSLANRARVVLEVVRAVRRAVGSDFPLSVKLNSDDFRKGGFTHDESVQVARWLGEEGIDLLEISGGNYEQPRQLGATGRAADAVELRPSTVAREAYFLEYAGAIRAATGGPLMVTGGFRTRAGMEAALESSETDVIGIARPLCSDPDSVRHLLERTIDALPTPERQLHLASRGWLSADSPLTVLKVVNVMGAQGWYYEQIERLADGLAPNQRGGVLGSFAVHLRHEIERATALQR